MFNPQDEPVLHDRMLKNIDLQFVVVHRGSEARENQGRIQLQNTILKY